jgi:transposase-like protein
MQYSEMFKRKMVQKMTGPQPVSASALSRQFQVSQTTLSKWLRQAGISPSYVYPYNSQGEMMPASKLGSKSPQNWPAEKKLKIVLEAQTIAEDQLGAFLRSKGIHETHLQQWRTQMLEGLSHKPAANKPPGSAADARKIKELEKELRRKEKALAEAAALLVLKKKARAIWADEDDDTAGSNGR